MRQMSSLLLPLLLSSATATIFMDESFDAATWRDRWIVSSAKSADALGEWISSPGDWYVDVNDVGIKTSGDARHYALAAPLSASFHNGDSDLFIAYLVKNEQSIDCGGMYVKLLPTGADLTAFDGDSPYNIMFGPDICGSSKRTHVILAYPQEDTSETKTNVDKAENVRVESDTSAHLYAFLLKKDGTYMVKIDGDVVAGGTVADDWPLLAPKDINDPDASQPDDWITDAEMIDPTDVKPEGYDDIPALIVDPSATQPEDWEEEDDGEWESPMISNPEYGTWSPSMIPNPDYLGPWQHPQIPNPVYKADDMLHARCDSCGAVAFDLWQMKSGTIFDDVMIGDDFADELVHETKMLAKIAALKVVKENQDAEKKAARKQKESEEKVVDEEEDEDEEVTLDEKDEL